MDIYNIRIINSGRNEYNGSIIVEENGTFYGSGFERNYDTAVNIVGKITLKKMHLQIITSSGDVIHTIANIENDSQKNQ